MDPLYEKRVGVETVRKAAKDTGREPANDRRQPEPVPSLQRNADGYEGRNGDEQCS